MVTELTTVMTYSQNSGSSVIIIQGLATFGKRILGSHIEFCKTQQYIAGK